MRFHVELVATQDKTSNFVSICVMRNRFVLEKASPNSASHNGSRSKNGRIAGRSTSPLRHCCPKRRPGIDQAQNNSAYSCGFRTSPLKSFG